MSGTWRRISTGVLLGLAFVLAPAAAQGSTTLGQTSATGSQGTGGPYTQIQVASSGSPSPSYTVPAGGGVITFWSHQGGPSEAGQLKLKVYRPTAAPDDFTVVGSSLANLSANTLTVTSTQIPVQAGDVLAYTRLAGSTVVIYFVSGNSSDVLRDAPAADTADSGTTNFNPTLYPNLRLNISAVLEPDNDGDGLGDETQDNDDDNDTILDSAPDNCPLVPNTNQADNEPDGLGDVCDSDDDNDTVPDTTETGCPGGGISTDTDSDNDTVLDDPDVFPCDATESADSDDDTVGDNADNCPVNTNTNQADNEPDGLGDVCDPDDDNDGVLDTSDGCPTQANATSNGCPAPPPSNPPATAPTQLTTPPVIPSSTKKCKKKSRSAVAAKKCKKKK